MTGAEAKMRILAEWRTWIGHRGISGSATDTEAADFYSHIQLKYPELLSFENAGLTSPLIGCIERTWSLPINEVAMLARKQLASDRAQKYAPKPPDTSFMTGIIGASIAGIILAIFSGFYSVNAAHHWIVYGVLITVSFLASYSFAFRRWQKHLQAKQIELARIDNADCL